MLRDIFTRRGLIFLFLLYFPCWGRSGRLYRALLKGWFYRHRQFFACLSFISLDYWIINPGNFDFMTFSIYFPLFCRVRVIGYRVLSTAKLNGLRNSVFYAVNLSVMWCRKIHNYTWGHNVPYNSFLLPVSFLLWNGEISRILKKIYQYRICHLFRISLVMGQPNCF